MAALQAGKHVFCESPLGTSLAQTEEMAALAQSQGVHTLGGLQGRGHPKLLRLKDLLEEGYAGHPLSCHMSMFLPGIGRGLA